MYIRLDAHTLFFSFSRNFLFNAFLLRFFLFYCYCIIILSQFLICIFTLIQMYFIFYLHLIGRFFFLFLYLQILSGWLGFLSHSQMKAALFRFGFPCRIGYYHWCCCRCCLVNVLVQIRQTVSDWSNTTRPSKDQQTKRGERKNGVKTNKDEKRTRKKGFE